MGNCVAFPCYFLAPHALNCHLADRSISVVFRQCRTAPNIWNQLGSIMYAIHNSTAKRLLLCRRGDTPNGIADYWLPRILNCKLQVLAISDGCMANTLISWIYDYFLTSHLFERNLMDLYNCWNVMRNRCTPVEYWRKYQSCKHHLCYVTSYIRNYNPRINITKYTFIGIHV